MSRFDQIIVAPNPDRLEQYAVWGTTESHSIFDFLPPSSVFYPREPFDYNRLPLGVFDTIVDAMLFAKKEGDEKTVIRFVHTADVAGYKEYVWDEFPRRRYLGMIWRKDG